MRWILIIVAVLVALVALMALAGMALPKAHIASRAATLRAAPPDVWQTVTDAAAYPSWRKDVQTVEMLPPRNGHPMWREKTTSGTMTYEVMESIAPTTYVTRIADEGLPYGGTWTYTLAPAGTGTRLTITERGEIYNPLFRLLARFVFGYTGTMDQVLKALGTKYGETIEPQPVA